MGAPNAPAPDANAIFGTLDRHQVQYVLVGGYAALAHGATRLTNDIDLAPFRTN